MRLAAARGLLLLAFAGPAAAAVDVQSLWDFADPARSEQRFRAAMEGASPDDRLVLLTQVARSWGLRRDFARAREVLAEVAGALPTASAEVRARHALELGRTHVSGTHRREELDDSARRRAREAYETAEREARAAQRDDLAVDALHMMAFVDDTPAQALAWTRRALALAQASAQPAAQRWEGSLQHNIGHALMRQGQHAEAREHFVLSREAHRLSGRLGAVHVADWMIAHSFRLEGRLDEALARQQALRRAMEAEGRPDPYVYEELELLHRARGETDLAAEMVRLRATAPR